MEKRCLNCINKYVLTIQGNNLGKIFCGLNNSSKSINFKCEHWKKD